MSHYEQPAATLAGNYARAIYDPYGEERAIEKLLDVDSTPQCDNCTKPSMKLEKIPGYGKFCPACVAEIPACPYCGAIGGDPLDMADQDLDVGYSATEQMCSLCAPRKAA